MTYLKSILKDDILLFLYMVYVFVYPFHLEL